MKKRTIYAECGGLAQGAKMLGSLENPLDINQFYKINWDKLIVNEVDYYKSLVYFNEFGLL